MQMNSESKAIETDLKACNVYLKKNHLKLSQFFVEKLHLFIQNLKKIQIMTIPNNILLLQVGKKVECSIFLVNSFH